MMVPNTIIHEGWITIHDFGETSDCVFVGNDRNPLPDELDYLNGKTLSARYWITDQKATKDEAIEQFLRRIDGSAEIEFHAHYSDITGYLWTDINLTIGGHDLLQELASYAGKYLILEIDIHD